MSKLQSLCVLFVGISVALAGCGGASTKPQEPAVQESSSATGAGLSQAEQHIKDSIEHATKEQQQIAYGDIRFNMSKDSVDRIIKATTKWRRTTIGEFDYTMQPYYVNDRLYMLELSTSPMTANYVDTEIKNSVMNLYAVISKKYGTPSYDNGMPKFFDYKPGYVQNAVGWTIGTKQIDIGVAEVQSGSQYYVLCRIYDSIMKEAIETIQADSLEKQKQGASNNF